MNRQLLALLQRDELSSAQEPFRRRVRSPGVFIFALGNFLIAAEAQGYGGRAAARRGYSLEA